MEDTLKKQFGKRIQTFRKETGLSQEKFALKIEMDRTYYASVESGKRNVSLENIKKIADGLGVSLSKLFEEFYQTSVEINNKKVFIINNINNSTDKVLNMILKFIEEPKDNVYGILISDEIDSLLETVKSRCQIIPFRELSKEDIVDEYMHDGFERLDAYLLMNIFNEYQKIDLNDELYLCARDMVYRTIEILDDAWMLEMEYQNNLYGYKDKKLKSVTDYYLSLMITVINDSFGCEIEDNEYQKMIAKLENYSRYELLDIFLKARDMCKYNYDRKLLLDSVAYKLGNIV